MVPIAYGGSAMAYKAAVEGAHASPLTNESLSVMGVEGQDQFVFVQNGEPGGLYCADETDGEALRVCEQISEPLLAYEIGGTESCRHSPRAGSPTRTSLCGRSTSARA